MLKCLLAPAAFLYKAGVTFRHRLFDWGILKSEKFDIPIICIGNITVGGTGKTPMAEMVIAYMSQMHNVALLSRGNVFFLSTNAMASNGSAAFQCYRKGAGFANPCFTQDRKSVV